jgi:Flp pilus assembly protein TadG
VEVLPFGVLIFVVGVLLVVNLWSIVDAKLAATSAAREAARAYVEAEDGARAEGDAIAAADAAIASRGKNAGRTAIAVTSGGFTRCARVTFEVTYVVPTLTLPFVGGFGDGVRVRARHGEIVDPYRNGPEGEAACV